MVWVPPSWTDLQSMHGFRCYDNIAPNTKCQRVLILALCLVFLLYERRNSYNRAEVIVTPIVSLWLLLFLKDGIRRFSSSFKKWEHVYTVSQKKNCEISFCQNFVKFPPIVIIFGRKMAKGLKLCEVYSFFISINLHHFTIVVNVDVYRGKCRCSKLLHNAESC